MSVVQWPVSGALLWLPAGRRTFPDCFACFALGTGCAAPGAALSFTSFAIRLLRRRVSLIVAPTPAYACGIDPPRFLAVLLALLPRGGDLPRRRQVVGREPVRAVVTAEGFSTSDRPQAQAEQRKLNRCTLVERDQEKI
jgi:hypothetical protein